MPETVYQRHYRNNREKRIAESKARALRGRRIIDEFKSRPCERCRGEFPTCAMDLHHVDERKDPAIRVKTVGNMLTYSETRLRAELDKCSVVCANCHRIIHKRPAGPEVAI